MKRSLSLLLLLALLLGLAPAGCAAAGESFAALTGLDTVLAALEAGDTIASAYYSDGYGFSTSEFTSSDPEEIAALLETLREIGIAGKSEIFVTDWYPQLLLRFEDGRSFGLHFDGHSLESGGELYELENDGPFWLLTAALVRRYEESPPPAPEEPVFVPNCVDLYFPANPTTGYGWSAEIEDEGLLELREQYFPDSGQLGFVGAGGVQWYHLEGVAEGVTSVVFRYARAWEESALYAFTYRLNVDERGSVLIWGVEMSG